MGHAVVLVATARASCLASIWAVVNSRRHGCEGRADSDAAKRGISQDTAGNGQKGSGSRHLDERAEREGHCERWEV